MSKAVNTKARLLRNEHAKKIAGETSTWTARKLRMTYSQKWRVEQARAGQPSQARVQANGRRTTP